MLSNFDANIHSLKEQLNTASSTDGMHKKRAILYLICTNFNQVWRSALLFYLRWLNLLAIFCNTDNKRRVAGVAELVDAPDLGSGAFGRGGSSPSTRTISSVLSKIYPKALNNKVIFGVR